MHRRAGRAGRRLRAGCADERGQAAAAVRADRCLMYAMLQGVIFASWAFAGKRASWRKVIHASARTAVFRGSARMAGASHHRELPARSAIAVYRLSRVTETGPCPYLFRRCVRLLGNDIMGDQGFYLSGMDDRLCGSAFGVVLPLFGALASYTAAKKGC